ncbi:hypothetical protein psal_cds_1376 [Pandoravirus salinus]|uniref:Uncharacterized protein n=1 Tax=Pandoravirus salinus TaxID=1349410 RepID=S4W1U4_9VIRU|nr:hypothetical protein psal_cds_1376 [Pandoravirus salinus]AGO85781.1 hypothetical protein psal_cds_1376 [Pandoravirus salinus]
MQQQQRQQSQPRTRAGCLRRLIVGELRSYSPAYASTAMMDTVATALIAGVTNSGRVYPGARVLSLTALDHASYPAGSGLCTMLCVVRWCGPSEIAWVATDLDLDAARAPSAHKIAEGALPESLAMEFYRVGLLRMPAMCHESSRPMAPPMRFDVVAVRPALAACVVVASDGSVSRRCPSTPGACSDCDRVWRTALRLVEPPPPLTAARASAASSPLMRPLARAIASVIAQTTTTTAQSVCTCTGPPTPPPGTLESQTPALPGRDARRRQRRQQQQEVPVSDLRAARGQRCESDGSVGVDIKEPAPSTNVAQATVKVPVVVAAAPVVHPRCACTTCGATSRSCTGKIVRVECTAGCRTPFHRACWRAMATAPDETRACATPDCWGLWARVTSVRRARDGSEDTPYIEWSRPRRQRPAVDASQTVAAPAKGGAPSTAGRRRRAGRAPSPTLASCVPTAPTRDEDKTLRPGVPKGLNLQNNINGSDQVKDDQEKGDEDAYMGRVRRRRPRQQLRGPPHKRIDVVKAVAKPVLPSSDTQRADERAAAQQRATRIERQQTDALVCHAAAAAARPIDGTGRNRHRRSRESTKRQAVPAPQSTHGVVVPQEDDVPKGPRDVYGVWAAFFEWDQVPLSLLPEAPATPPPVGQMWAPPPLLRDNVPHGSAVWTCLCTPVPLA